MELVGAACGLVPCLWPSLTLRINYVKNLKKNFTKLEKDVEALCNLKKDIDREIESDTSKILSGECQGWTKEVEKIETEVKKIKEEVDENRRCLNDCCFPDICARKSLGKRIVTMLNDVEEHNKKADFKGPKYVDAPPAIVENEPLPSVEGSKTAIDHCLQRIMQSIRDAKTRKIGLWGMGGIGKTTALKTLNNLPEIAETFQIVIWVTVSKGASVTKVQKDIAKRLKIDTEDSESDQSIARKLIQELQTKNYLLLLDDLWSGMKWEGVGIPIQEGSKVVLTTRFRHVCRNMETDDDIKVEGLSPEEAWSLFREKAGQVVDSPSIESIARDIVKECAGLPLAVEVIGKCLRKVEDIHQWRDALKQLRWATFEFPDDEDSLFERLKLSYDRLKDVEQSCFLYCALYPEDYEIPVAELVELWRAEGLTFRGGMDSLDDADAKGRTIVNNLVDSSLLERTEDGDVKMHDVLRDLALRITSSKFLVRAGSGIEECPDEKEWEEVHRISLIENKFSGLPPNPRCDELSTLLLEGNEYLKRNIPDMFFQHMHSLRVLNLNWTDIKVLPTSVSNLVNLRGLYVVSLKPVDLPPEIGALEKLEALQVNVGSLPLEVRQLTSLRRLWVEFNRGTEEGMRTICSNGVISSLFLLEDLRICFNDDLFDAQYLRREWCKLVDVSRVAEEVGRLKRLTKLQFDFSTIECLEHFLLQRNTNSFPGLKDFHLSMSGSDNFEVETLPYFGQEMKKTLICNWGQRESSSEVMSQMLNEVLQFKLRNHKTAISLSSICEDPHHRFTKLTKLVIQTCPNLSCVFTQGTIQHMPNLEELQVWVCDEIEEIVREDVETNHHLQLFFPKLRELKLINCPNLVRIWKEASQPWPSIEKIEVLYCPNLENLNLNDKNPPAALKEIKGETKWWEALEWEDEKSKHRLQPLFKPFSLF